MAKETPKWSNDIKKGTPVKIVTSAMSYNEIKEQKICRHFVWRHIFSKDTGTKIGSTSPIITGKHGHNLAPRMQYRRGQHRRCRIFSEQSHPRQLHMRRRTG